MFIRRIQRSKNRYNRTERRDIKNSIKRVRDKKWNIVVRQSVRFVLLGAFLEEVGAIRPLFYCIFITIIN